MLYEAESGEIRIAAAGDAMVSHPLSIYREERFLRLAEVLRGADASICNLEMPIHSLDIPHLLAEGSYGASHPDTARELKWMGFNMVATASNHVFDFGPAGMLESQAKLDEAGVVHAGTGRNLSEARAAGYMDTARGRVALLASASSFPEWARAGEQRHDFHGRPGVSFLRYETVHTIDERAFKEFQRLNAGLGFERVAEAQKRGGHRGTAGANEMYFQPSTKLINGEEFPSVKFVQGDAFGSKTNSFKPDMEDILRWVRDARRQADWVVYSLHGHEGPYPTPGDPRSVGPAGVREVPADFMVEFAHACIDAGADVFFSHGAHQIRGIEIYKGRPIFYSLGEFLFQNETVPRWPADSYRHYGLDNSATPADYNDARTGNGKKGFPANPDYWRSVVPVCQFKGGKLASIELYPIDLGHGKKRTVRGRPLLAAPNMAREVIETLQRLSKPYGTEIVREGDRGIIRF